MPRQARPSRDPARSQIPDAPRAIDAAAASRAVRAGLPCAWEPFTRPFASRLPVCAVLTQAAEPAMNGDLVRLDNLDEHAGTQALQGPPDRRVARLHVAPGVPSSLPLQKTSSVHPEPSQRCLNPEPERRPPRP